MCAIKTVRYVIISAIYRQGLIITMFSFHIMDSCTSGVPSQIISLEIDSIVMKNYHLY